MAKSGVNRFNFLAGVATGSVATAAAVVPGAANAAAGATEPTKLAPPSTALAQADTGPVDTAPVADHLHVTSPGSDYMVDVVKNLGVEYLACMPGSTFRGIHESFVNHGKNTAPELISCHHEEISAAIAHGYAKVAGKPMAILVHNTVGLQHASMAIYNAWCDRVPMLILAGNIADAAARRPGVEWDHTAVDVAAIVRGYVKYDDSPMSLDQFRESTTRGFQIATTPPFGAALIVVDGDLAENPPEKKPAAIDPYHPSRYPVGDPSAIDEIAKLLVDAQNPVIIAGRMARTPAGMEHLIALAELLQVPVIDDTTRMNFPSNHYLNSSFNRSVIGQADVVLALEVGDLFGILADVPDVVARHTVRKLKPGTKVLEINSELGVGAGNYQDKQRFYPSDIPVPADAEATLPSLIEAVQRQLTADRRAKNEARAAHFRGAFRATREAALRQAPVGWDQSPVNIARLCMEVWNQIKGEDWALVSQTQFLSKWPQRLWDFTKHYQWIGDAGGGGVGYVMPGAVGAALAHKAHNRLVVNICGDGELLAAPGSLWTAAKHRIPLLTIVHNNRAWHQEVMHLQRMATRRDRDPSTAHVGTTIDDPAVDFAKLAAGYGMWSEGPISDPSHLASALKRAIAVVKSGQPALLDVITQPR